MLYLCCMEEAKLLRVELSDEVIDFLQTFEMVVTPINDEEEFSYYRVPWIRVTNDEKVGIVYLYDEDLPEIVKKYMGYEEDDK